MGSSKLASASEFGVLGRLSSDGSSMGRLLSDRDENAKPGPHSVAECAKVNFLFPAIKLSTFP